MVSPSPACTGMMVILNCGGFELERPNGIGRSRPGLPLDSRCLGCIEQGKDVGGI